MDIKDVEYALNHKRNKEELFECIQCALYHRAVDCDHCRKCGPTAFDARQKMLEELKEYLDIKEK